MSQPIPMIRAGAIAPMLRWLSENGKPSKALLESVGLGWLPEGEQLLPIPLSSTIRLLVAISRSEGPETPHRIVDRLGGFEIGLIGWEAFLGPTVKEGLQKVSRSMRLHCTHELFSVSETSKGLLLSDGWASSIGDNEALHLVQQYVAALVDMICGVATGHSRNLARTKLVPHPEHGLSHLRPWLGQQVFSAHNRVLEILIDSSEVNQSFAEQVSRTASSQLQSMDAQPLTFSSLSEQVDVLVAGMLPLTVPTIGDLSTMMGTSVRTLRRRLQHEGSSVSQILERRRAKIALGRLCEPVPPKFKDLAVELGFSGQSTLTRAVKRWTGKTPTWLRNHNQ